MKNIKKATEPNQVVVAKKKIGRPKGMTKAKIQEIKTAQDKANEERPGFLKKIWQKIKGIFKK